MELFYRLQILDANFARRQPIKCFNPFDVAKTSREHLALRRELDASNAMESITDAILFGTTIALLLFTLKALHNPARGRRFGAPWETSLRVNPHPEGVPQAIAPFQGAFMVGLSTQGAPKRRPWAGLCNAFSVKNQYKFRAEHYCHRRLLLEVRSAWAIFPVAILPAVQFDFFAPYKEWPVFGPTDRFCGAWGETPGKIVPTLVSSPCRGVSIETPLQGEEYRVDAGPWASPTAPQKRSVGPKTKTSNRTACSLTASPTDRPSLQYVSSMRDTQPRSVSGASPRTRRSRCDAHSQCRRGSASALRPDRQR